MAEKGMEKERNNYDQSISYLKLIGNQIYVGLLKQKHRQIDEFLLHNYTYKQFLELNETGHISDEQLDLFFPPTNLDNWGYCMISKFLKSGPILNTAERQLLDSVDAYRRDVYERFTSKSMSEEEMGEVKCRADSLLKMSIDQFSNQLESLQTSSARKQETFCDEGYDEICDYIATVLDNTASKFDHNRIVHDAAYLGKLRTLQYIAETCPERLHETDEDGAQATHYAAQGGRVECLKFLQGRGLDPYKKDEKYGESILFKAIIKEKHNAVKFICQTYHKLTNEPRLAIRETPLTAAASLGNVEIVRFLLQSGANIDMCSDGGLTAGHLAAKGGKVDCLKLVIESGFDPYTETVKGNTILHFATLHGALSVVEYICETFPDMITKRDFKGNTCLHNTAFGGHLNCMVYLVKLGMDVDIRSTAGYTVLHNAAYSGHLDIVRYLCENYGHMKDMISKNNETALYSAVRGGNLNILKYLIGEGINVSVRCKKGHTLLDTAAYYGYYDIVHYFCANYDNMKRSISRNHETVLHSAVRGGHLGILQFLLDEGMDVNVMSRSGHTILHIAANNGSLDIVQYLCENYKNTKKVKTINGDTVLHSAVRGGHLDVIQYLLHQGVDFSKRSRKRHTILEIAANKGRKDIVECISNCRQFYE